MIKKILAILLLITVPIWGAVYVMFLMFREIHRDIRWWLDDHL